MDPEVKMGPKKIEISSSSLVALKAELLSKQAQVKRAKADGFNTIHSRPAKVKNLVKKNSGVEARAKRDEEQKKVDDPSLDKSRIMLEEKAKLYERLCGDKALLDEDTISEEQSLFLVNFQQKVVENTIRQRSTKSISSKIKANSSSSSSDETGQEEDYAATNPEDEWVDYVDSFGRTRRCLRKDLPNFQLQDAELNKSEPSKPVSYGNFVKPSEHTDHQVDGPQNILGLDEESRKRQRALWEEEEERNRQKSNVHYQDILYQEARQHGAGFYSFSKDEEERAKQMDELETIRKQTEAARKQTAQTNSDKQLALEARLKKVRDRKRQKLGLPPLKEQPKLEPPPEIVTESSAVTIPTTDSDKDAEDKLRKTVAQSLPQSVKVRPWDLGKEGVPKQPVMTQHSWVEKKREERKQEFAPPPAYMGSDTSKPKRFANTQPEPVVRPSPMISEDSIVSGLAFMKQMSTAGCGGSPTSFTAQHEEAIEENDDGLFPPGESDMPQSQEMSSRWRSVPSRGVEVAPPTFMDYYNSPSSKARHRGVSSQRPDMSDSFSVGIKQRKNVIGDNPSTDKAEPPSQWNSS